jgi:protein-S-isoprenylcysteine O-methyltransferase Ste14
MNAYFNTNHPAGLLLMVTVAAWGMMELGQRSQPQRQGATKIGGAGGGRLVGLAILISTAVVVNLAPRVVPAATIRPGVVAFAVGMVILLAGLVLRGWSFKTLDQYFTHTVMVSTDQPVVASGPYRVLRHPSYTGIILAIIGIGLASANWAGLTGLVLLTVSALLVRIRTEERALMTTLGDRYRAYAAQHKRLVPLVW